MSPETGRLADEAGPPQAVTRVEDRQSTVIRRFEGGREVSAPEKD